MLHWLDQQMHAGQDPTSSDIFLRIVAALVLGCIVAFIHHFTRSHDQTSTNGLLSTIVLLSILLAMVVMAVGSNFARAFTLAGVLAIVRFRTVVKDTRDTAFVICAVVVGMAAGAGYLDVALIGLPFIALAAYFTRYVEPKKGLHISNLHVRFHISQQLQARIEEILRRQAHAVSIKEASTSKKGTAMDISYRIRLKKGTQTSELVRELHALEGMQSVEWKS